MWCSATVGGSYWRSIPRGPASSPLAQHTTHIYRYRARRVPVERRHEFLAEEQHQATEGEAERHRSSPLRQRFQTRTRSVTPHAYRYVGAEHDGERGAGVLMRGGAKERRLQVMSLLSEGRECHRGLRPKHIYTNSPNPVTFRTAQQC